MALKTTNSGDYVSRTSFIPNTVSACGWYYQNGNGSSWGTIFAMGRNSGDMFDLQHHNSQTLIYLWCYPQSVAHSTADFTIAQDKWYFFGLTVSTNAGGGGTAIFYHAELGNALTSDSVSLGSDVFIATGWQTTQSESPWLGEYCNGRFFNWMVYQSILTSDEMERQMTMRVPIETSSLWAWYPTFSGSGERVRDYGGNGRDWTENGTVSDDDNAPVSYGPETSSVLHYVGTSVRIPRHGFVLHQMPGIA